MNNRIQKGAVIAIISLLLIVPFVLVASGEKKEEGVTLVFWWWGEQEVVGMTGWIDETISKFEAENPNIKVESTLQATEVVLTQFPNAAAAGGGPDLLFRWNGIYHLPWVWLGYLEPLENHIPADTLKNMNVDRISFSDGKTYSIGWYTYSNVWAMNKELYRKAGLKPVPPVTWDELLNNCKALKRAGIQPISLGYKDLFTGEWTFAFTVQQGMDGFQDLVDLATGKQSWADYKYWEGWEKYLELFEMGYLNEDMLSLDISQGMDVFLSGEAAMSMVPSGLIPSMEDMLGAGVADIFPTPIFGDGRWAGKSPIITNGFAMSSLSKHKEETAQFFLFMHTDDRMSALYNTLNAFPADKNFNWSQVTKPLDKKIVETIINAPEPIPWVSELIPPMVMNDIGYGIFQQVFTGEITPQELGRLTQESMDRWREEDPEMVDNYIEWLSQIEW
jgi:ABC-type glycerol-3-phosphate transport system substrate-binding protein